MKTKYEICKQRAASAFLLARRVAARPPLHFAGREAAAQGALRLLRTGHSGAGDSCRCPQAAEIRDCRLDAEIPVPVAAAPAPYSATRERDERTAQTAAGADTPADAGGLQAFPC